jgi:hypothetical protein
MRSVADLVGAACALGADEVGSLSPAELQLLAETPISKPSALASLRSSIRDGEDPLGAAFCALFSPAERRPNGATYTPLPIVKAMLDWAEDEVAPQRIVDPGAGSGRFTLLAGRRFPRARIVAAERDPLAALLLRANLAACGLGDRADVYVDDYRALQLPAIDGPTLFAGNPPYVRHHHIEPQWKRWLTSTARAHGHTASQLAGLHVHFFLATLTQAVAGDAGVFITSAEWLDVNYGRLVRDMLLDGLGGQALHVLEPELHAFEDAATTAAIACFRVGTQPEGLRLRRVRTLDALAPLTGGQLVGRDRLVEAQRWTPLTRTAKPIPEGLIELGELCRVHRGAVTGANRVWVVDPATSNLPKSVLFPSVTRARELFAAGTELSSTSALRSVVDLPPDLDVFESDEKKAVERFLRVARRAGAHAGYIARHRRAWWSVGLREAAPLLSTYMARKAPAIVANPAGARHINIAHGLYPREPLRSDQLAAIATAVRGRVSVADGRTYAGGLTKFEPRELERILIPDVLSC